VLESLAESLSSCFCGGQCQTAWNEAEARWDLRDAVGTLLLLVSNAAVTSGRSGKEPLPEQQES